MISHRSRSRRGFAMLTLLWVIVVGTVLALAATLAGRDSFNAARNRVFSERAYWRAADCLARARALIDATLQSTTDPVVIANLWRTLGAQIVVQETDCSVSLEAAGTRLDVNAASDSILLALFEEVGYVEEAPAMLDAFRDWTDSDSVTRPLGAEADWYAAAGRPLPRNGPLADIRELAYIRGFENTAGVLDSLLTTEQGRISLPTASLTVLGAIPGFSDEALQQIAQLRESGVPITDLAGFASSLSPAAMQLMGQHFDEISRLVTVDPEAWIVRASGQSGFPAVTTVIEQRLVRAANQAVSLRQRVNP